MLRGIAQSLITWVGNIIMAVVMGFLSSASPSGASAIFSAVSAAIRSPRSAAPKSPPTQFRQIYQTQLQQFSRRLGRADHHDRGPCARPRSPGARRNWSPMRCSMSAHARCGLAMSDKESRNRIISDPTFAGPTGKFDRRRSRRSCARRLHRADASRRTAPRLSAPRRSPRPSPATCPCRKPRSMRMHRFRTRTRSIDYFVLPGAGRGDIPAADGQDADQIFRRSPDAFPRARISQARRARRHAGERRRSEDGLRCRREGALRAAQGSALRHAREARGPADRISRLAEAAAPRANASPRALSFRRSRQGARSHRQGHRSRHRRQRPTCSTRRSPMRPSRSSRAR